MKFANRARAGQELAKCLRGVVPREAVIYALPRGGVPVAVEVALALGRPLDLLIPRKIGHPFNPEYAIGAVTEHGEPVLNAAETAELDAGWLRRRIEEEREEAHRRRELYCAGRPRLSARGRCAVLVDDGIATGLTMEAAVREVQGDDPASVIVAVAVAPRDTARRFEAMVSRFVAAQLPESFQGSVGAYYEDFGQTRDDDVLRELARLPAVHPALA